VLDAAWRYRERGAEMSRDLLALWPLSKNWRAVGRWYYDLVAERTLESVVGLEYESCCWSVRVVTRDKPFLDEEGELQSDRSIYFTLELKGLAGIGRSLESVIEDGMVGL
jgi:LPS-assembly protein